MRTKTASAAALALIGGIEGWNLQQQAIKEAEDNKPMFYDCQNCEEVFQSSICPKCLGECTLVREEL
jgi:hypothetical protein